MAPKANAAGLQKAFRELGEQLAALQPKGGAGLRRGDSGPKWDCKHCDRGLDNYPDRTTCYRCKRDRNAPAIPKGASGPSGERAERAASVRTRKVAGEPAPMLGVGDGEVGEEEDPIAVELAAAKSYTEWVRRQKAGPAREKELASAHKRLAEAELADKRRKPPAERLQSALSRVNHWDKEWEAGERGRDAALAVLEAKEADLANIGTMREEARKELETAQAMHAAWGQPQGGDPGTYCAGGKVTPHQEAILRQISDSLQVGSPASAHLIELMATMGYPGLPGQGEGDRQGHTAAGEAGAGTQTDRAQRSPRPHTGKQGRGPALSSSQVAQPPGKGGKGQGAWPGASRWPRRNGDGRRPGGHGPLRGPTDRGGRRRGPGLRTRLGVLAYLVLSGVTTMGRWAVGIAAVGDDPAPADASDQRGAAAWRAAGGGGTQRAESCCGAGVPPGPAGDGPAGECRCPRPLE